MYLTFNENDNLLCLLPSPTQAAVTEETLRDQVRDLKQQVKDTENRAEEAERRIKQLDHTIEGLESKSALVLSIVILA